MTTNSSPHTKLIQNKVELTDSLKQQILNVHHDVLKFNDLVSPTVSDINHLNFIIDDFNFYQKYIAVNQGFQSPYELIEYWVNKSHIPQIKLSEHSFSLKKGISFYTYILSFDELYNANKSVFPDYTELCMLFSSLCNRIFDVISNLPKSHPLFYIKQRTITSKNPYKNVLLHSNTASLISISACPSNNELKNVFGAIFSHYFPEHPLKFMPTAAMRHLVFCIAKGISSHKLVNRFLALSYYAINNQITEDFFVHYEKTVPLKPVTFHGVFMNTIRPVLS